jgi:hypothetical protein
MAIISVIIILACFLFLFLFRRKREHIVQIRSTYATSAQNLNLPNLPQTEAMHSDEHRDLTAIKKRMIPRKTFLCGFLRGKYRGEMIIRDGENHEHEVLYDFHIYEADVYVKTSYACTCITPTKQECSGLHTEAEGSFTIGYGPKFPRERLPRLLLITVKQEGKDYAVNIHEPQLSGAAIISRLHQTDGREAFGTIEANITGYLLDFIVEEYLEESEDDTYSRSNAVIPDIAPIIRKGKIRSAPCYSPRTKYGSYRPSVVSDSGCVSSVLGILAIVVWATFLIAILPQAAIILSFIAVPLLFRLIPSIIWQWSVTIIGAIVCLGIIASIFSTPKYPKHVVKANPAMDTANRTLVNDSMIMHHLRWKNYDGQYYQGSISLRRSAWADAAQFKTSLQVYDNNRQSYDEVVYRLKEHDKDHLPGVYHLFDSIRVAQHLETSKFAELIVSFVQEIPYAVVLPEACNASLYADPFIKDYLSTPDAKCDGYQKFGINTPVEFLSSLKGDCDTRTLLLYTILSHYGYDVALLSSEYYNHSLIGINLPYSGIAYTSGSKQYVLWETTTADIRPGVIPFEISNLNYWRISLKSN